MDVHLYIHVVIKAPPMAACRINDEANTQALPPSLLKLYYDPTMFFKRTRYEDMVVNTYSSSSALQMCQLLAYYI
jgi:hypothetical protein